MCEGRGPRGAALRAKSIEYSIPGINVILGKGVANSACAFRDDHIVRKFINAL